MPGSDRERIPARQVTPVRGRQGYGKSELARLVGLSPTRISQLAKNETLKCHEDGSIIKESAHTYFAEEFVGTGVLVPEESKLLVDEALGKTEERIQEAREKLASSGGYNPSNVDAGYEGSNIYDIEKSRARHVFMQSELIRVKIEREQGLSIARADAQRSAVDAFRIVNQGLLNLPSRLTDLVVGLDDKTRVKEMIRGEVESIIKQLHNSVLELVEDEGTEEPDQLEA